MGTMKKPANWDKVPNDWACMHCKKTKHQGINFYVAICKDGFPSVKFVCNTCTGKGLTSGRKKGGYRSRALPIIRLSTKQKIAKYFEENY